MESNEKLLLYHLTSYDRLPSILAHGLIPHNGHHCRKIRDRSSDVVFLCKKEDIKFWVKCFKDVDTLIEIDCTSIRSDLRRRYQKYAPSGAEYGCTRSIPPECFSSFHKVIYQPEEVKETA